ncbi:MAG: hypothetical protein KBT68_09305 [bacterium]|nr:hypothetical protein [Candidatus Colisoma equi]
MTNAILWGKPQAGSLLCKDVLSAIWFGSGMLCASVAVVGPTDCAVKNSSCDEQLRIALFPRMEDGDAESN